MNIGFAKIGKSIKFCTKFSPAGGDNEAPQLVRILANNNPSDTIFLMGRSDFSRLSDSERIKLFPYDNVVDLYWDSPTIEPGVLARQLIKLNKRIDCCVFMLGQVSTVSIPDRIKKLKDPSTNTSIIEMARHYSMPIIDWWNDNYVPVVEVINDPRYTLGQTRDVFHLPVASLSQYNGSYKRRYFTSYEDQTQLHTDTNIVYAGMEKIFLYDRSAPKLNNPSTKFMMVLNEGSPSRYDMLKEWILDRMDDVEIYGVWDDKITESDARFKGSLQIEDLQKKLRNVKYTFIIPIAPGWTTSKYIEMIYAGVIPFFHPTYDSQLNLKVPDILRPKTPDELFKTIDKFEKTSGSYEKMITLLRNTLIKSDDLDGSAINDKIMKCFDQNYKRPDLTKFSRVEEETGLSSFF